MKRVTHKIPSARAAPLLVLSLTDTTVLGEAQNTTTRFHDDAMGNLT